ncbi:MAG: isoprenylcysteine carboxylmethyltransferase family protein [Chlorobium sp.]|nr:isoprenylcysteine carboxylmethyltransferase family protein [Chlorobium sp.]MCW8815603.1 isoprenylcysteine carboxylmethyltransferase family protein [Chlorobium sp.]MCW8819663.1 isoprenylcysteine carboxylmethyltransferase family protein [Ignavibacteriaceae bacterium]
MNNEKNDGAGLLKGKKGEYLVVLQLLLVLLFIVTPVWNPLVNTATESFLLPRTLVLICCSTVALLFGALGSHNLRNYITPLPYPVAHNKLVTTGVFSLVRHPLYSSQLFIGFGWACYTLSLSHLLLLITAFLFFSFKAGKEERWLTERHPEYKEYARMVKKFIPWMY